MKRNKDVRSLLLIMVLLLVFWAYLEVPEFGGGGGFSNDSKLSNLRTNLQSVRAQLELYRLHHNGEYPEDITKGLTMKSDADGTVSATGAYGPYLQQFPANPFVGDPAQAVKTSGADGEGWSYRPVSHTCNCRPDECDHYTCVFFANTPEHNKGQ